MAAPPAPPTTACQLERLPDGCLLAVLQRLDSGDTNHRSLFSAARACSRLNAAAADVRPGALQVEVGHKKDGDAALDFLRRQGQHVTSLSFDGWWGAIGVFELPSHCRLHSLSFSRAANGVMILMQLAASSEHPGVLQGCGGDQLTRLEVIRQCVMFDDSPASTAAALARLRGLKHLQLDGPAPCWKDGLDWREGGGLPDQLWSSLSGLTHLSIRAELLADDATLMNGISCMAGLAELRVAHGAVVASALSRLSLTRLVQDGGVLQPRALGSQLQHLSLKGTEVATDDGPQGTAALLQQLAKLAQLTTLVLEKGAFLYHTPRVACYSALCASSGLRRLELDGDLPSGVWRHVFPPDVERTALDHLKLKLADGNLSPGDVAALVDSCPRLAELHLPHLALPRLGLAAGAQLQPLACLSRLSVLGLSLQDASAAAGELQLDQLSGLRRLVVSSDLSDLEAARLLLPLTHLGQLTRLQHDDPSAEYEHHRSRHDFFNKAPEGSPPDVWRQLLEVLAGCSDPAVRKTAQEMVAIFQADTTATAEQ